MMEVESLAYEGDVFKVGDDVELFAEGNVFWYGRIQKLTQTKRSRRIRVIWYYRPEDTLGGRQPFHGAQELFTSEYGDWQPIGTISRKVIVHDLASYMALQAEEESVNYFTRFKYIPTHDRYEPDQVPVYCICEMPFNPDQIMLRCASCEEWFHPSCLGMKPDKSHINQFTCTNCM